MIRSKKINILYLSETVFKRLYLQHENFQDFNCAFSNNCAVDLNTRRFCQKCRLEKCFAVGMKKEWILSDNEKARKKSNKDSKRYL